MAAGRTMFGVLAVMSFCHLLNDMFQSLVPAIYPILKSSFDLNFTQIGGITFAYQTTASLLQPLIGFATDRRPMPFSLPVGMMFTLVGLLLIAQAPNYATLVVAASLVGVGSAVFHPEASRVAHMAAGRRHGLAQSLFQVGGNTGASIGPLLAAIVLRHGRSNIAWFSFAVLLAIAVLWRVSVWYREHRRTAGHRVHDHPHHGLPPGRVKGAIAVLIALIFSKYIYIASLTSYYTFYLMHRFQLSIANAQFHLFFFAGAIAAGTVVGGPIGDKIGRKYVIWASIFGVLPFTLALPHVNLFWTSVLSVIIGLIMASAFSAILVYAHELIPGRVGMISGLFFGLAFGVAGIGAQVLGRMADSYGLDTVYQVCAFLPAVGILAAFLPNLDERARSARGL